MPGKYRAQLPLGSGLSWDAINGRLGIGTASPGVTLDVVGQAQFGNQTGTIPATVSGTIRSSYNERTTDTSQQVNGWVTYLQVDPAGASTRQYVADGVVIEVPAANAQNLTSSAALTGQRVAAEHAGSGTVTGARAVNAFVNNVGSGTITTGTAHLASVLATTGNIGTGRGYVSSIGNLGAGTLTTGVNFLANTGFNSGGGTYTRQAGYVCAAMSGATHNSLVVLGQTTVPDGAWAIYSASASESLLSGHLNLATGVNLKLATSGAGTMIGAGATELLGLWGATPVVQPSGTGETVGFTAGVGAAVLDDSTFTGNSGTKAYTIGDVVKHLKAVGILAAS